MITFVYKTDNSNYEEVFEDGICFFDETGKINGTFERVYNLFDYLGNVDDNDSIYIIEIPDEYLEVSRVSNKQIPPYPILFEREMFNPNNKTLDVYPVLVPCLISKMFNGNMGCFANENYNVKYNPCGLKFSKEQLDSIKSRMGDKEYSRFSSRNENEECKYLYSIDCASNFWNQLKLQYNVIDPVEPFAKKGDISKLKFKNSKTKKFKPKKNKKNKYE